MLRNKLPPLRFHEPKRNGCDVRSLKNKKATGFKSLRYGFDEPLWGVHVFNHMKAGDHIEIAPRQCLDYVAMDRSYARRSFGQVEVGFHAKNLKRLFRNTQKIAARAADFQKASRPSKLVDQVEAPARIEESQALFLFESQVTQVDICSLKAAGHVSGTLTSESKLRSARPYITKAA